MNAPRTIFSFLPRKISRVKGTSRCLAWFTIILSIALSSCVSDPLLEEQAQTGIVDKGVIVVNQGIWRQDNASLSLYLIDESRSVDQWFMGQNPSLRLGDSGNDIAIWKDRAFVAVSESDVIEVIEVTTGISQGRIQLPPNSFPGHIVVQNDSTGWVSNLEDDSIIEFDPSTFSHKEPTPVGPAPEGIAIANGRVIVANSGLGKLRANEPNAGTLSVVDPGGGGVLESVPIGGNLRDVEFIPTSGNLYIFIAASLPDTSGSGIVEIDPTTFSITRRWSIPGAWEIGFDNVGERAYVASQKGVTLIDLSVDGEPPYPFISGTYSTLDEEVIHSIGVSQYNGEIFIGYARGYFQAPGRVDRYDQQGNILGSFEVGLNPVAFGFY